MLSFSNKHERFTDSIDQFHRAAAKSWPPMPPRSIHGPRDQSISFSQSRFSRLSSKLPAASNMLLSKCTILGRVEHLCCGRGIVRGGGFLRRGDRLQLRLGHGVQDPSQDALDNLPHASAQLIVPCGRPNPLQEADEEGQVLTTSARGTQGMWSLPGGVFICLSSSTQSTPGGGDAPAHKHPLGLGQRYS